MEHEHDSAIPPPDPAILFSSGPTNNHADDQPPAKKQHLEYDDDDDDKKQWPIADDSGSEEEEDEGTAKRDDLKAYVESDAHKAAVAELNEAILQCLKHPDKVNIGGLVKCRIPRGRDDWEYEDPDTMAELAIAYYNKENGTVFKVEKVQEMKAAFCAVPTHYYLTFTANGAVARSVTFKACVDCYDTTTNELKVAYCKYNIIQPGFDS